MIRVVLPAGNAPQVRIDGADDELVSEMEEERFHFRGQQIDRATRDVAVCGKAPCERRRRQQHQSEKCGDERFRHASYSINVSRSVFAAEFAEDFLAFLSAVSRVSRAFAGFT